MPTIAPAVDIRLKSVLIATDFSKTSERPLRHALALARHYGSKFCLAHVVSAMGFRLAGPDVVSAATDAAWRDGRNLENDLVQSGALAGLRHDVIVRLGDVWPQLEQVIRQEEVDMVVIGTHGRRGLGKLVLGSVAEQIFRHADCPVLTVGPGCGEESPAQTTRPVRPFLFATDFQETSLHALPCAISFANHFGARLVLLHVIPSVPMPSGPKWCTAGDVMRMRESARMAGLRQLEALIPNHIDWKVRPEFVVQFGSSSEKILQTADTLQADAIVMGLHRSGLIRRTAHMPWATASEVVCRARCAVLTVRN
jgi:nucleotide-binding universal stress UspA family protein